VEEVLVELLVILLLLVQQDVLLVGYALHLQEVVQEADKVLEETVVQVVVVVDVDLLVIPEDQETLHQ
tara:strand:- start:417 stop:620 length:204 start_codon:yes stop_codon:yes gene_type:complete